MTLKDFENFLNSILAEAELPGWRIAVQGPHSGFDAVASCSEENKTIFIGEIMKNRPDYEVRALVERELAHAREPKKYHKRNGKLIEDSKKSWLLTKVAALRA